MQAAEECKLGALRGQAEGRRVLRDYSGWWDALWALQKNGWMDGWMERCTANVGPARWGDFPPALEDGLSIGWPLWGDSGASRKDV